MTTKEFAKLRARIGLEHLTGKPVEVSAGELASLLDAAEENAKLRPALTDAIDSLEYVNRTHPEASGWGVRLQRIKAARDALERKGTP